MKPQKHILWPRFFVRISWIFTGDRNPKISPNDPPKCPHLDTNGFQQLSNDTQKYESMCNGWNMLNKWSFWQFAAYKFSRVHLKRRIRLCRRAAMNTYPFAFNNNTNISFGGGGGGCVFSVFFSLERRFVYAFFSVQIGKSVCVLVKYLIAYYWCTKTKTYAEHIMHTAAALLCALCSMLYQSEKPFKVNGEVIYIHMFDKMCLT